MPAPDDDDPRWSLELAGGALMDLGCYGLHVMRRLGPPVGRARARRSEHSPGVDAWCDVEIAFPSGATGLSSNSMVGDEYTFTHSDRRHQGDVLVHDFVKPQEDDRLTMSTPAGTVVEHLGTRASYTYQLEAFAAHVLHGTPLPFDTADAVENMAFIDAAYRAAGYGTALAAESRDTRQPSYATRQDVSVGRTSHRARLISSPAVAATSSAMSCRSARPGEIRLGVRLPSGPM